MSKNTILNYSRVLDALDGLKHHKY